MVLVHDDDLVTIDGLSHGAVSGHLIGSCIVLPKLCWQSPETLESDMMIELFRRSNMEIHKVPYGELLRLTHKQDFDS